MQSVTLLCPSPLMKDKSTRPLIDEYTKRISARIDCPVISVKTKPSDPDTLVKQKQAEALLTALEKLPQNTAIIVLDERGKNPDSIDFSQDIEKLILNGSSHFCFIIGGAFGLTQEILDKADYKLAFGKMVWPHRLVAVMLLEQIYRTQQILAGHPYHKA